MWIYWFQSITIGFFNFIRILQLKEFSTEGFKINDKPAQPTQSTKIFTAFFFLFHYGLFHFGYMTFILTGIFTKAYGNLPTFADLIYIFLISLLFFINHLFSYVYNKPKDTKKQNIGALMFYPYARIIPMHLTIIFGSAVADALSFFLVLKTFADAIMHIVEHNVLRKGELQEA
jgi:cellulose synthase/poly-beta-1,6-N-acetylglucosamine synthase-like glycosyltransferase